MADHLRNATKKVDYISREAMHKANQDDWDTGWYSGTFYYYAYGG